jgi:hypothetical protein
VPANPFTLTVPLQGALAPLPGFTPLTVYSTLFLPRITR